MAIKVTNTSKASRFINLCVYGRSGVGKTRLASTVVKPLIISAENGTLSLQDEDIPVWEIEDMDDLMTVYKKLKSSKYKKLYKTIVLDSITEIAESVLSNNKRDFRDGRKAYGETNDLMHDAIRAFRDLPYDVVFIAKQQRLIDDATGLTSYLPGMPGKTLLQGLPYYFDEVLCLHVTEDDEGEKVRYLQTTTDVQYEAKDRSGKLKQIEKPDLGYIIKKCKPSLAKRDTTQSTNQPTEEATENGKDA